MIRLTWHAHRPASRLGTATDRWTTPSIPAKQTTVQLGGVRSTTSANGGTCASGSRSTGSATATPLATQDSWPAVMLARDAGARIRIFTHVRRALGTRVDLRRSGPL